MATKLPENKCVVREVNVQIDGGLVAHNVALTPKGVEIKEKGHRKFGFISYAELAGRIEK